MTGFLEDQLGKVPGPILGFIESEIMLFVEAAQDAIGCRISVDGSPRSSMRCECAQLSSDEYQIRIPAEFVTRVALVSELLYRARNPNGMRKKVLSHQHAGSHFDYLKANSAEKYEELFRQHRDSLASLPSEYKALVGSFDHSLALSELDYWLQTFSVQQYKFIHWYEFREQFRFSLLFVIAHELMHVVLQHFDRRDEYVPGASEQDRRLWIRRRFEVEADCGAVFSLVRFSLRRALSFLDSANIPPDDPRYLHARYGQAYAAARGSVLAMAFLDCSKMWEDEFKDSIYFAPASRVTYALVAMEGFFRTTGRGLYLLKSSYASFVSEESWWFRTRTVFQDTPHFFEVNLLDQVGKNIADLSILELSYDISDFMWSNLMRHELRGINSPFNISFHAELNQQTFEKMSSTLKDGTELGDRIMEYTSSVQWDVQEPERHVIEIR